MNIALIGAACAHADVANASENVITKIQAGYYYIAFRDNGAGDFKVGNYLGNGSDNRGITGFGFQPDFIHIMDGGKIVKSGGPELADMIEEIGFEKFFQSPN